MAQYCIHYLGRINNGADIKANNATPKQKMGDIKPRLIPPIIRENGAEFHLPLIIMVVESIAIVVWVLFVTAFLIIRTFVRWDFGY